MRPLLPPLLALLTVASGSWAYLQHRQSTSQQATALFESKRLALVEQENERLRGIVEAFEKEKQHGRLAGQRTAIEQKTAAIRGLDFKETVDYTELKRAEVAEVLSKKLAEQYSDAEFQAVGIGYAALGLIPEGFPLKQMYVELLQEQMAAFYDQTEHKLFMYEDASLDTAQNRVVLSHELVHALQDQHFDLKRIPIDLKSNDDRAIAASALIEGDATLVMNQYLVGDLSVKNLGQFAGSIVTQSLEKLMAAPRYLRETLLFPYTEGAKFCQFFQDGQSFREITQLYSRLPGSSSEILHPELYLQDFKPLIIDWKETTTLGEKPLADNVLGELGTRILLADWVSESTAPEIAEGWSGDRYLVFAGGNAVVWRSTWSSKQDRDRFESALHQLLAKRYKATPGESKEGRTPFTTPKGDRTLLLLRPSEKEVVLVNATEPRWAEALEAQFGR